MSILVRPSEPFDPYLRASAKKVEQVELLPEWQPRHSVGLRLTAQVKYLQLFFTAHAKVRSNASISKRNPSRYLVNSSSVDSALEKKVLILRFLPSKQNKSVHGFLLLNFVLVTPANVENGGANFRNCLAGRRGLLSRNYVKKLRRGWWRARGWVVIIFRWSCAARVFKTKEREKSDAGVGK